jgi:hypothetical protein
LVTETASALRGQSAEIVRRRSGTENVRRGRRYIVCRNEEEARKDAETRATLLAGLQRKLASGAKGLVDNAGYRRFLAAPDREAPRRDPLPCPTDRHATAYRRWDPQISNRPASAMPSCAKPTWQIARCGHSA